MKIATSLQFINGFLRDLHDAVKVEEQQPHPRMRFVDEPLTIGGTTYRNGGFHIDDEVYDCPSKLKALLEDYQLPRFTTFQKQCNSYGFAHRRLVFVIREEVGGAFFRSGEGMQFLSFKKLHRQPIGMVPRHTSPSFSSSSSSSNEGETEKFVMPPIIVPPQPMYQQRPATPFPSMVPMPPPFRPQPLNQPLYYLPSMPMIAPFGNFGGQFLAYLHLNAMVQLQKQLLEQQQNKK